MGLIPRTVSDISDAYKRIPPDLDGALRMTPMGVRARQRIAALMSNRFFTNFRVNVASGSIAVPFDHGNTSKQPGLPGTVTIQVTTANSPNPDRMTTWNNQEKINIITCHELRHVLTRPSSRIIRVDDTIPPNPFNVQSHLPAFKAEFKARIEYSIFQNATSSPRINWLANYVGFFNSFASVPNGTIFCENLYVEVIEKLSRIDPDDNIYVNRNKHPQISQAILQNISQNKSSLITQKATYGALVP